MLFEELPKHNCRPWSVVFCFTSGAVLMARVMDQITIKTSTINVVFNRVFILEIQSVMLVFSAPTIAPLTFSLVHLPPPPPPQLKIWGV
jgi:hypothetical protein